MHTLASCIARTFQIHRIYHSTWRQALTHNIKHIKQNKNVYKSLRKQKGIKETSLEQLWAYKSA